MSRYLPLIGRVLIGLPSVMSGLGKLAAYGPTTAMVAAVGQPRMPYEHTDEQVADLQTGFSFAVKE